MPGAFAVVGDAAVEARQKGPASTAWRTCVATVQTSACASCWACRDRPTGFLH